MPASLPSPPPPREIDDRRVAEPLRRAFGIEVCDQHPDLVEFRDNGAAELHKIAGGTGQTLMTKAL
jgi:hypothetical protein